MIAKAPIKQVAELTKDPKIAGNIVVSSNVKIHKKVLKMLKPALKK